MTTPRPAEMARVADAVVLAVERLLAEGRSERVVVHVNPTLGRIVIAPPDGEMVLVRLAPLDRAA